MALDVLRPQAVPDAGLNQDELRAVLDQELSRLPEKYRTPLVLHYLEGKSKQETAGQLGWTEGTVSGRLARARELLRGRLVRRGFVLSTAGITSLLVESTATAALAPRLLGATIKAALCFAQGIRTADAVSSSAATLAKGMVKNMLIGKIKFVTSVVLLVSVVLAGAGTVTYRVLDAKAWENGPAPEQAKNQGTTRPETEKKNAPAVAILAAVPDDGDGMPPFSASGKIVDEKGRPVAGAKVYLREQANGLNSGTHRPPETRNLAVTNTDRQGQFNFDKIALPQPRFRYLREETYPLDVIVMAKGYALAWIHLPVPAAKFGLSFVLQPESTIRGRLVDQNGKPAPKVPVRALQIMALTEGPRPAYYSLEKPNLTNSTFLNLEFSDVPLMTETDADGRFSLGHLPAHARVDLLVADDRFLPKEIYVATTNQPQSPLMGYSAEWPGAQPTLRKEIVYSSDFTLPLDAGTRFHGKIVFQDTGKPAAGARVTGYISSPTPYVTADEAGRFSITQLPIKGWKYRVEIYPPENTDYLDETVDFDLSAEKRVVEATVQLRPGVPIIGKVVDDETGKGVSGVNIYHVPNISEVSKPAPSFSKTESKADGSFRISAAPGQGHLVLHSAPPGYLAGSFGALHWIDDADRRFNREIVTKEGQPFKDVTFTLGRGSVIHGQVVDSQGKPVPAAQIETVVPMDERSYMPLHVSSDGDGKYILAGLKADKDYQISFRNKQRTLGTVLMVPLPADKKKVEVPVTLLPAASVSGRVIDEDQKPIVGVKVSVNSALTRASHGAAANSALTDDQGKYRVTRVLPGDKVFVWAAAEGYSSGYSDKLKAESGKDFPVPDVILLKMDQAVAGVVVDQKGKPLAGVELFTTSGDRSQAPTGRQRPTTGSDGRFRLTGLPAANIEVWGVLPWDRQHSSLLQRVQAGDHNAKIVVNVPN